MTHPMRARLQDLDTNGDGKGVSQPSPPPTWGHRPVRRQRVRRDIVFVAAWLACNGGEGDPRLQSLNLGGQFISVSGRA